MKSLFPHTFGIRYTNCQACEFVSMAHPRFVCGQSAAAPDFEATGVAANPWRATWLKITWVTWTVQSTPSWLGRVSSRLSASAMTSSLYNCSTDRLCIGGAPVNSLAHSNAFHSKENNAPSNIGINMVQALKKTGSMVTHHSPGLRVSSGCCSGSQIFHHSCMIGLCFINSMSWLKSSPSYSQ